MVYVLEQHECIPLSKFCINKEALWLLVRQAAKSLLTIMAWFPPSPASSLRPPLGPVHCQGWPRHAQLLLH